MDRTPDGFDTVATPALVLDAPKMMHNIARLDAHAASLGVTLRPHLKTVKSTQIAQCLSGGVSAPITVSTLAEAEAFHAAQEAFVAAVDPDASIFPVVLAHASDPQNRFTIKSAAGSELAGLKIGSYFPTNDAQGLPRHASTIVLIDQNTGKVGALVEGSRPPPPRHRCLTRNGWVRAHISRRWVRTHWASRNCPRTFCTGTPVLRSA